MSVLVDLAQGITDLLNQSTLSQPFTAARCYLPNYSIAGSPGLEVKVVPADRSDVFEAGTRGESEDTAVIYVAIYRQVARDNEGQIVVADVDAMLAFVEEVTDLVKANRVIAGLGTLVSVGHQSGAAYRPEYLEGKQTFMSVVELSYRFYG